jgi:TIR domain
MSTDSTRKDFFISYNHADEGWATWMAWVLENVGYSTILQAWDFRPGSNFAIEMDKAVARSDRTIAVVSENFLRSTFTAPEWTAAFSKDPNGAARKLVPVRVEECQTDGLLGQVVRIDLVGLGRDEAAAELLAGLQLGRAKPLGEPAFPGKPADITAAPESPSPAAKTQNQTTWQPLPEPLKPKWQVIDDRYRASGSTVVEVQLIPVEQQRVEVRRLQTLKDELAAVARTSGLVSQTGAIESTSSDQLASVRSSDMTRGADAGLAIWRSGSLGGWLSLPADGLGAVLDQDDLTPRLQQLLTVLIGFNIPTSDRYALAVGVSNTMNLTVGSASIIGRRTSASLSLSSDNLIVEADDSISLLALRTATKTVAEELVARLMARLNAR